MNENVNTTNQNDEKKLFTKGRVFELTVGIDNEFNRSLAADGRQNLDSINARYLNYQEISKLVNELFANEEVQYVAVTLHTRDSMPCAESVTGFAPDYHHGHIDVLIKESANPWSRAKVKSVYKDITGKEIYSDFITGSRMREQNAPSAVKFAGMVVYATHDIKVGAGHPDETHHISCTGKEWDWNKCFWLYDKPGDTQVYGTTLDWCFKKFSEFCAGAAERAQERAEEDRLLQMLEDIGNGTIREWQLADPNICSVHDYCRLKSGVRGMKLDHALDRFYKTCLLQAKQHIGYKQVHIAVTGDSGSGKTTWCVEWCRQHNKSYYIASSGKNFIDDYQGESVIIMDDFRSAQLPFWQFLQNFDNNQPRSVAARYYNRCIACADIVMFPSVIDPMDWYEDRLEDADEEDRHQLRRRVPICIDIRNDTVTWKEYNMKKDIYEPKHRWKWTFDPYEYFKSLKQTIDNDPEKYLLDNFAVPGMVGEEIEISEETKARIEAYHPINAVESYEDTPPEAPVFESSRMDIFRKEKEKEQRSEASPDEAPVSTEPDEQQSAEPVEPALQFSDWVMSPLADDGFEEFNPNEN